MLKNYCKYNTWANQKIATYILSAGEVIADHELLSSFSTIRKTMLHIWDAQLIWMARLNGQSFNSWPSKDFKGSLEDACLGLVADSTEFEILAEKISGAASQRFTYKNQEGSEFTNTAEEIIMHCMNHGTYHRGQIITMLRQAGFTAVGTVNLSDIRR